MLTITERATSELQAVRATNDASPEQGVRLTHFTLRPAV